MKLYRKEWPDYSVLQEVCIQVCMPIDATGSLGHVLCCSPEPHTGKQIRGLLPGPGARARAGLCVLLPREGLHRAL